MWTPQELYFQSSDDRFGISLPVDTQRKLIRECTARHPNETGGILLGSYSRDLRVAIVTHVTQEAPDSRSGPRWFQRGIEGIQRLIDQLWKKKEFYLGEWHLHPGGTPVPSAQDIIQMEKISQSNDYACPEPILLIIGGSPKGGWEFGAYITPKDSDLVTLYKAEAPV